MRMNVFEMEGFLRGRCVPRDLKVNETDAEYLVRKFDALEAKCAAQENKVIPVSTELPPANESVLLFDATRAFDRAVKRARERYEKTNSLCDESFLKDLRFHDLRHEATSRLAEIFPMHELTKITGHKDPRMLMRYYHPKAEDLALKLK